MSDMRKKLISKLLSKYKKRNRYANFGPCINYVKINGFRGMSCEVNFEFPVTAISGLNGAGKSTIGQILLCAYKSISTSNLKRWYVKDFFPVSIVDPNPFINDAYIEYRYQTDEVRNDQALTVKRAKQEWSGYKRQPEKAAIYIGLAFYLPKVERRDLTIYSAKGLTLSDRVDIENAKTYASRILGNTYEDVFFQGVKNNKRSAELGMATRMGSSYSENNMGFGEGRVIHAIRLLESCPQQSLIVLEEPETSLHEFAQYEFTKYLMDVSDRRGHQIIFSSHSSTMINALPPEGRKLIIRHQNGVKVYDRVSSIHIKTALTDGKHGHLIVCVEDKFAKLLLSELLRKKDKELLNRIRIHPYGDAKSVKNAVLALKESNIKSIGIRDGDQSEDTKNNLFVLPGGDAPEKVVYYSNHVKLYLKKKYDFDIESYFIKYPDTNHHEIPNIVAENTHTLKDAINTEIVREFLSGVTEDWGQELIIKIKDKEEDH